jgi:cyclopropane-fatty-acyl-phospholipid synthase
VREAGLETACATARDYRGWTALDRIVSVGMFEHVGPRFYDTFFSKCRQPQPDGVMVLHTIGHLDGPWYQPMARQHPPADIFRPVRDRTGCERSYLIVTDVECLRLHYAETLAEWRRRFMARRAEALALYDERFCRMWEYYLASCEAAFRFQNVGVFQVQCARRLEAVPMTREYIAERIHDLRMREAEQSAAADPTVEPLQWRKQRL